MNNRISIKEDQLNEVLELLPKNLAKNLSAKIFLTEETKYDKKAKPFIKAQYLPNRE